MGLGTEHKAATLVPSERRHPAHMLCVAPVCSTSLGTDTFLWTNVKNQNKQMENIKTMETRKPVYFEELYTHCKLFSFLLALPFSYQ